jgi:hypothetical protein
MEENQFSPVGDCFSGRLPNPFVACSSQARGIRILPLNPPISGDKSAI